MSDMYGMGRLQDEWELGERVAYALEDEALGFGALVDIILDDQLRQEVLSDPLLDDRSELL